MQKGIFYSALPMTEAERAKAIAHYSEVCGDDVTFTFKVDRSLLGGIRVLVDGRIYDYSYASRLEKIHEMLKEGEDDA